MMHNLLSIRRFLSASVSFPSLRWLEDGFAELEEDLVDPELNGFLFEEDEEEL